MKITEIQIKNFGKLHNINVRPLPGLNVIYGENETGKSTMQQFITGMLFGMEKQPEGTEQRDSYQQYEPWNGSSPYAGGLKFTVGDKPFFLERNFEHKEKSAKLVDEMDGEELSVEHGDLEMLMGGMKKTAYENTYCIQQAEIETKKEFVDVLQNYFVNASSGGDAEFDVPGAQKHLLEKKTNATSRYEEKKSARNEAVEKLYLEEELLKKDIEQLQKQQKDSHNNIFNQSPNAIPPERDTNQMAEYLRDIRQKKKQQTYMMRGGISLLITLLGLGLGIINAIYHPLQEGQPGWMALELFLLFAFLGGAGSVCHWFHKHRRLKLLRRRQQEEAKEINLSVSKDVERQKMQEKQEKQAKQEAVEALLQEQLAEKQTALINLQDEIAETLKPTDSEQELEKQIQAYELANHTLQALSQNAYEDTRSQLEQEMSQILAEITHGKYDKIGLDEQMNLMVEQGAQSLPPWQLSQGVMEQMYVALRMGAGGIFTQEESLPIILDEVFASFDEKRLEATLQWLSKQKGQIFLFTCRHREMEILDRNNIPYGKIMLSR